MNYPLIDSLFNRHRFLGGPFLLFLILYAPLGLVLLTIRVFISLQLCLASLILPTGSFIRKFVLRVLFTVMGVVVREKGLQNKVENSLIVVTNYITPFDHLVISLVYPCVSISVNRLPGLLSTILCCKDMGISSGKLYLNRNIKTYLSKSDSLPLLLHPEGSSTNGKVAVMKYGSWAFEFDNSVLALGLKVYRIPLLPIEPSVLGSSWPADLFYALFSPVTIYTINYIGKITKQETDTAEDMATRTQKATAAVLNIEPTYYSLADKIEYIKRLDREEAAATNPFLNPNVHSMALRVKEVLPYLPLDIIKRDIVRTRNVDVTITNFLEGRINEPIPSPGSSDNSADTSQNLSSSTSSADQSSSSCSTDPINYLPLRSLDMSAKTFGKSANERMLSFQERKNILIETARQRYIEKKKHSTC